MKKYLLLFISLNTISYVSYSLAAPLNSEDDTYCECGCNQLSEDCPMRARSPKEWSLFWDKYPEYDPRPYYSQHQMELKMNLKFSCFFLIHSITLAGEASEQTLERQLESAIEREDASKVRILIQQKVSPNFSYKYGEFLFTTPLIRVIRKCNLVLFDAILTAGDLNVNYSDHTGISPLGWICSDFSRDKASIDNWVEVQARKHIRTYMAVQLLLRGAKYGETYYVPRDLKERDFLLESRYQADQILSQSTDEPVPVRQKGILVRSLDGLLDMMAPEESSQAVREKKNN